MARSSWRQGLRAVARGLGIALGAAALTLVHFLVLPLMQTIARPPEADLLLQAVDTATIPPPPPPPEPEPEQEPEPEDPPPELTDQTPPLDLAQLELALQPGFGGDGAAGDFAVRLNTAAAAAAVADALFSLADLDQKPRVVYQPSPVIDAQLRRKAPGTVHVLFAVDQQGRVEEPRVQSSTDPVFERAALHAVKQWRFEPGKRNGQPVRFRMRVPITFPAGA